MKQAITLTQYGLLQNPPASKQAVSNKNKRKPMQAVIIPMIRTSSNMKKELKRWIHGYKIVKDCGDHFEEVNPCPIERTTRANADITLVYFNNQGFYKLPTGHRFLKMSG